MYSTANIEALGNDEIWCAIVALGHLDDAATALSDAVSACRDISEDAAWHNDGEGARSMRRALEELRDRVGGELSAVRNAADSVRGGIDP